MYNQNKNFKQYMGAHNVSTSRVGIKQLIIPSNDLDTSSEFLENFLHYKRTTPPESSVFNGLSNSITFLTPNGFIIHLGTPESTLTTYSTVQIISLTVRSLNETKAKLDLFNTKLWCEFNGLDKKIKEAFFTAPDGTIFHISSYEETSIENAFDTHYSSSSETHTHKSNLVADDLFNHLGHCGVEWILLPTHSFDVMINLLTLVFEYTLITRGVPQNEHNYSRYALFSTPSGVTLELLEINIHNPGRFKSPIISFTVENLSTSIRELKQQKIEILSEIIGSKSWGWIYLRIPQGSIFQLQGPR